MLPHLYTFDALTEFFKQLNSTQSMADSSRLAKQVGVFVDSECRQRRAN